ncbi:MAG: lamin tail domain-containing protein [archaeon]
MLRRGVIWAAFAILLMANAYALPIINEVMPNPISDWNGNGIGETYGDEWVEIYSPESLNLNGWMIGDKSKNYTIGAAEICTNCFLIFYGSNTSLQLNNDNEEVFLYDSSGNLADKVTYSASSKDVSFSRCGSNFVKSTPSLGYENQCSTNQTGSENKENISLEYPAETGNRGSELYVNLTLNNFIEDNYDIKIEVRNSTGNIARIFDGNQWISSFYYLNGAIKPSEGKKQFRIKVDGDYSGDATIQIKVRNNTYSTQSGFFDISIINSEISSPQQSATTTSQAKMTDSIISLSDYPKKASFGETINVNVSAYRGETSKYTLYLYIQKYDDLVSEKVSIPLDERFGDYSYIIPLSIKSNCDSAYDEGVYNLILEGLNKIVLEEINLKGNYECNSEQDYLKKGKITYKILDVPGGVNISEEFTISLKIYNNQNEKHQFAVWSYIYENNKCYSCGNETREDNAQNKIIGEYDSASFVLKNTIYDAKDGVYSLKIKILREDQETTKDFTFKITAKEKNIDKMEIKEEYSNDAESILNKTVMNNSNPGITGKVIYGASKKSTTSLLFLLFICLMLLLYVTIKNKKRKNKEFEPEQEEEYAKEEINVPS